MHRTPFLFLLVMAAAFGSPCGAQPVPRDTDFIVRKIRGDGYHAAFVNHDRSSPSYESLEDFSFADSIGPETLRTCLQKDVHPTGSCQIAGCPCFAGRSNTACIQTIPTNA